MDIINISILLLTITTPLAILAHISKKAKLLRVAMNGVSFSIGMLVVGVITILLAN